MINNKCDICERTRPYNFEVLHGVVLCADCREEYRRKLLTRRHLEALKSGEWIPQRRRAMTASDNRQIEYIALSELLTRMHPSNPKEHDIGAIIESYKHHGYVASGVIDDRTGLFLAGHGRVMALNMMQKQGMEAPRGIKNGGDEWLVPVQVGYQSENDTDALAYLAADNQLTIAGGWDEPALAELLQEVSNSVDTALEATGFNGDELDNLLRDLGQGGDNWNDAFSGLPDEDRQPFQQVTFTLHDSQLECVKEAIVKAKSLGEFKTPNENSNGNALDRICRMFIDGNC